MQSLLLAVAPDGVVRNPVGGVEPGPEVGPELVHDARTKVVIATTMGTQEPALLSLMRQSACLHPFLTRADPLGFRCPALPSRGAPDPNTAVSHPSLRDEAAQAELDHARYS